MQKKYICPICEVMDMADELCDLPPVVSQVHGNTGWGNGTQSGGDAPGLGNDNGGDGPDPEAKGGGLFFDDFCFEYDSDW